MELCVALQARDVTVIHEVPFTIQVLAIRKRGEGGAGWGARVTCNELPLIISPLGRAVMLYVSTNEPH